MSKVFRRDETDYSQAYTLALERRGFDVRILELPEKYLQQAFGKNEEEYRRADLDGALAQGLSSAEVDECLGNAKDWRSYPAPLASKFTAAIKALGPAVLDDSGLVSSLCAGRSSDEVRHGLKTLATALRHTAYCEGTHTYNNDKLEEIAQRLKQLFKTLLPGLKIDAVRRVVFPESTDVLSPASAGLAAYDLREVDNAIFHIRRGIEGAKLELAINFAVVDIRTGQGRYADGQRQELHRITIREQGGSQTREIDVLGSLYDPKAVLDAGGGSLTIASIQHWKTYISHRARIDRVQGADAAVDRVYVVGTYLTDQGQLVPSDRVRFPKGREECHYHLLAFAPAGDKGVFGKVAALFSDLSIAFILTWGLGTVLKPALSWTYPHLLAMGEAGTGKSTIRQLFLDFFGWLILSASTEFGTPYRARKLLSNSVLPIQVEEIGRVSGRGEHHMTEFLNQSYNVTPSTYGDNDKRFVLMAPALLWGQDFGPEDVALQSKLVQVTLDQACKSTEALEACEALKAVFPMSEWVQHVCSCANQRDIPALRREKEAWLGQQAGTLPPLSGVSRMVTNYAILLVAADALRDFGIPVDIDDFVVQRLKGHLAELTGAGGEEDRSTIARQFVFDLLDHFEAFGTGRGLVADWRPEGLYCHVRDALTLLRKEGQRYDIRNPNVLRTMLFAAKLAVATKHYFTHAEKRCLLIPDEKLRELGIEYRDPGQASGNRSTL